VNQDSRSENFTCRKLLVKARKEKSEELAHCLFTKNKTEWVYLYSTIKGSTGESICILGVKCDLHDIVRVALKDLSTHPALIPVPELYEHVI
jgi:hypothetical protein